MKLLRIFLLPILVPLLLTSCVVSHATRVPGKDSIGKRDAESVELLFQEPSRAYEVIGFVAVDSNWAASDSQVYQKFRKSAATLGADALIIESLPHQGAFTVVQGRGKAIKWKQ